MWTVAAVTRPLPPAGGDPALQVTLTQGEPTRMPGSANQILPPGMGDGNGEGPRDPQRGLCIRKVT